MKKLDMIHIFLWVYVIVLISNIMACSNEFCQMVYTGFLPKIVYGLMLAGSPFVFISLLGILCYQGGQLSKKVDLSDGE